MRHDEARSHNRSGDQLWEKTDVQGDVDEGRLGLDFAAVHVDDIADRLERIKADADRENDAHHRQAGRDPKNGERRCDVRQEEIVVLEETEDREVDADARRQQRRSPTARRAREHLACDKRIHRDKQHQKTEAPVPDGVENVARDRQQPSPGAGVATGSSAAG